MHTPTGKHVLILAGGGITPLSGGVGTLLRYLTQEWATNPANLPTHIIDTRGPAGLRAAIPHFTAALAYLVKHRSQVACAHLHMTTRGSALRKSILLLAARALGIPTILHLHGADFLQHAATLGPIPKRGLQTILNAADTIVVIGNEWRTQLAQTFAIPQSRLQTIRNGVPPAPRATPNAATPHVLFLGRLGERKGTPNLLAALASPSLANLAWSATLAGDGDPTPYLANLPPRTRLLGWQSPAQTDALLASASLLVLPSRAEVLPIAILEAMARAIPILATPVGALPEILIHNHNAWLVQPDQPEALAQALATLIASPETRARLGQAGLETWQASLTIAQTATALQALYQQAASRARPSAARQPSLAVP